MGGKWRRRRRTKWWSWKGNERPFLISEKEKQLGVFSVDVRVEMGGGETKEVIE